MLATTAEFPNPGSTGYLRDTAQPLRVIQCNADRTLLVADAAARGASGTRTIPRDELYPTVEHAVFHRTGGKPPKRARR